MNKFFVFSLFALTTYQLSAMEQKEAAQTVAAAPAASSGGNIPWDELQSKNVMSGHNAAPLGAAILESEGKTKAPAPVKLFDLTFQNWSDIPLTLELKPFENSTATVYPLPGNRSGYFTGFIIPNLEAGRYNLTAFRTLPWTTMLRSSHRILVKAEEQDDPASATNDLYKLFWAFRLGGTVGNVVVDFVPQEKPQRNLTVTLYKEKARRELVKMIKGEEL